MALSTSAVANTWNRQLTTPDGWLMLATGNFRHRHTVVDEISWCPVLKTTMDHDGKLLLHFVSK